MSSETPSRKVDWIRRIHKLFRETRRLIERTKDDAAVSPSDYLDACLALTEASVNAAAVATAFASGYLSKKIPAERFIERMLDLDLSKLPPAEELVLPAQLIRRLNENRYWTGSSGEPQDAELGRSVLWSVIQLNHQLQDVSAGLEYDFEWSKRADRVPIELHPPEPPDLQAAFNIYFRLRPDTTPGRSFALALREFAKSFPFRAAGLPENSALLAEMREEVRAVKRELAAEQNRADLTSAGVQAPALAAAAVQPDSLVTLDQAAATTLLSKEEAERLPNRPVPRVGEGDSALYLWSEMRSWLTPVLGGVYPPSDFPGLGLSVERATRVGPSSPEFSLPDEFISSLSGRKQRALLLAVNGKGRVLIAKVLKSVYESADDRNLEALLKVKDRTNRTLAEKNVGCELRQEGETLVLSRL